MKTGVSLDEIDSNAAASGKPSADDQGTDL
jgi:hypothetical protein